MVSRPVSRQEWLRAYCSTAVYLAFSQFSGGGVLHSLIRAGREALLVP